MPKIVVGLGNPGPKYETTRHNVGFLLLDYLVDEWKARGPSRVADGEVFQADVRGERVYLVKPLTYMNNSGRCVGPVFKFYKSMPSDLIVIHDDLDLQPLSMRLKTGGGTGGHNGLKSIDAHLGAGATAYHRVRLGIGRPSPEDPETARLSPADYVLQPFTDAELRGLEPLFGHATQAIEMMVQDDVKGAMNRFNAPG